MNDLKVTAEKIRIAAKIIWEANKAKEEKRELIHTICQHLGVITCPVIVIQSVYESLSNDNLDKIKLRLPSNAFTDDENPRDIKKFPTNHQDRLDLLTGQFKNILTKFEELGFNIEFMFENTDDGYKEVSIWLT